MVDIGNNDRWLLHQNQVCRDMAGLVVVTDFMDS